MSFNNIISASVRLLDGKFYLELPDQIIKQLNISASDCLDIAFDKDKLRLWKSQKKDVPQHIYDELNAMFKGNEQLVSKWLCQPRVNFEGKSAIDLVETPGGIKIIQDFIRQLRMGDFS
jgi:hypothetical protein